MKTIANSAKTPLTASQETWLETVYVQVASLRLGVLQIVVHDSQVVQIERTVNVRLDRQPLEG